MESRFFTKTFFKFFFGFLVIIAIAFGVLIGTSAIMPAPVDPVRSTASNGVDTIAHPQ